MANKIVDAKKSATKNAGFGAKGGMATGPHKPTAPAIKSDQVAAPNIYKQDIRGVSAASAKDQPMYTGKASKPGKMVDQTGTGIAKVDGKGYQDSAKARTKATKQQLDQG